MVYNYTRLHVNAQYINALGKTLMNLGVPKPIGILCFNYIFFLKTFQNHNHDLKLKSIIVFINVIYLEILWILNNI